jgi:hypothetical protein
MSTFFKIRDMRILALVFAGTLSLISNAQIVKPAIFIETDFKVDAGENPPYYSVSNQNGVFSGEKSALILRSGIIADFDTSKKISLSYGLDAIGRYDSDRKIWLQQAFLRARVFFLVIQGGLVEEHFGNQDEQLSTGAYLFSENARPMPKIALSTNDYVTLPYTNNLLEIKGYFAHGWFGEKDQYVENAYLHQKYFYIRFGEKRFPISINLGLHHVAMWGGTSPDTGSLPVDWEAYKSVLLGKMKDDIGPVNERKNVLGNHLASYSLGIDYTIKSYRLQLYWQTMLEDKNGRVGVDWKNKGDGLWGIVIKKQGDPIGLQKVVLEFFNSTSQSGDREKSGDDNYFNNFLYRSGWTYHNMTIGTPLITSPALSGRSPGIISEISLNANNYLDNNRLRAISAGILYKINQEYLCMMMTYSRNYGTVAVPYNNARDQLYSLIEYNCYSKRYPDLFFSWQFAFDIGSHVGNNAGLLLRVRKTF